MKENHLQIAILTLLIQHSSLAVCILSSRKVIRTLQAPDTTDLLSAGTRIYRIQSFVCTSFDAPSLYLTFATSEPILYKIVAYKNTIRAPDL